MLMNIHADAAESERIEVKHPGEFSFISSKDTIQLFVNKDTITRNHKKVITKASFTNLGFTIQPNESSQKLFIHVSFKEGQSWRNLVFQHAISVRSEKELKSQVTLNLNLKNLTDQRLKLN